MPGIAVVSANPQLLQHGGFIVTVSRCRYPHGRKGPQTKSARVLAARGRFAVKEVCG